MLKIGALQMTSVLEPGPNVEKIKKYLCEAKDLGLQAVFLPECFYSMSDGTKASPYLVDPIQKNEHYQAIQNLAKGSGLYLLGGSAASWIEGKVINRNYNFGPDGTELVHYDKMNLFACDLSRDPSKKVVNEGAIYTPGTQAQTLTIEGIKIGLAICFDLRFPEMFRAYSGQGCQVLSISAAFTVPTGRAHWHVLLRARAIENQCYVIAPAQWGEHNEKTHTFGHSLIIDPWGQVLADAGEGEKLITAQINPQWIQEVRQRLDVLRPIR